VSVKKISNTWHYYFRVNGARYRKAIPEARTKYQAQEAEAKARDDVFEGKYGKKANATLFKAFVNFVLWQEATVRCDALHD
jgi:hypothetical protein